MNRLIYIAGPLYSQAERDWLERLDALCQRLGFRTFLPHRDAGLLTPTNGLELYQSDCAALEKANFILAVLDGPGVDSGTAWELGYARRGNTPLIGIRTDSRSCTPFSRVNLMIERCTNVLDSFEGLQALLLTIATK